jgi:glycosyltransferase involved in cell wall biosynthesis
MPTPAVSVLMPVYNAERYLREAIESILGQTFRDFEFIIVDDGSTDRSSQILLEFASRDARIRILSRPNTGIVGALNDGLALCTADLVARMDADDIALPERFAEQVRYMNDHPDCVLVGSRVLLIDPDGAPIRQWVDELSHDQIDQSHLARGWPVVHPTVMIRRHALNQLGGYREQYATLEDLDLFLRLAEIGQLANHPKVLLKYRQHFNSICHKRSHHQSGIRDAILDETWQRRGMPKQPTVTPPPPRTIAEAHRLWGWWALNSGHTATARKHAFRTLRHKPFSKDAWRLTYCALRGH